MSDAEPAPAPPPPSSSTPPPTILSPSSPPRTTPHRGIIFTSTRAPPRRPSSLPPITPLNTTAYVASTASHPSPPLEPPQRRLPHPPTPRIDPAALRVVHWTALVVTGIGLTCALGGVLFYQLSKDEEAMRKGREVRRKRWGYLEASIKGERTVSEEERWAERERQRREREQREREAEERKQRTGWRRLVPW